MVFRLNQTLKKVIFFKEATKLNYHVFKHLLTIPVSVFLTGFAFSQNINFDAVTDAIDTQDFVSADNAFKDIDTSSISTYDKAVWLFYYSDFQFRKDNHDMAYQSVLKSKQLFESIDASSDVSDCNFMIVQILSHQDNLKTNNTKINNIIEEEFQKAQKSKDSNALREVYFRLAAQFLDQDNGEEAIKYFNKELDIVKQQKDTLRMAFTLDNIGIVHSAVYNNPDSALYYARQATPIYEHFNDLRALSYNHNNIAQQYKLKKEFDKAIKYYKKADSLPNTSFEAKSKVIFYENMAEAYQQKKDYQNASLYLDKLNKLKDSINDTKQNIAISEIQEKYDNEKLRANNLETEAKRKQTQNIAIGLGGSLVLGSIIGFLLFKNTKRKQKLAEQEKEIDSQKLATVLKEQELTAIDAMIAGQEKERQRIANDLHDDLGGLMATVKLHFNALKDKDSPELFNKTNALIEEAYQKVRTVAHAKNSGVIAKQGLLKAVEQMAEKISAANKIHIEVLDHGLDNRLENSLELTLFRIIQELITNVIKHANASEATIHLTNHDDSINIMVEDNGKGFNPSQVTKTNKGMGISSIDKRIEHLNGKMTIESEKNKGATVIIDVPL